MNTYSHLPSDIEAPQFQLFQKVTLEGDVLTIAGMWHEAGWNYSDSQGS